MFFVVIMDDYFEFDLEWFYWEFLKVVGMGFVILVFFEVGENLNFKEIEEVV